MEINLSHQAINDLKTWIESNVYPDYLIDTKYLCQFLENTWVLQHYPQFGYVVPMLTKWTGDGTSYMIYLCQTPKDWELFTMNRFVIQSKFASMWNDHLIDKRIFIVRIIVGLFGIEIIENCP